MQDKTDNNILKELDNNPKISLTKLAKKLRISQQVADYRIKRLLKNKVISKFGTVINLNSLSLEHYRLFITFTGTKKYTNDIILKYLKNKKGVFWAVRVGGRYDLHIALFVFDFNELDSFIDDFNEEFPGLIKDYKSCYGLTYHMLRHKYLQSGNKNIEFGYKDKPIKIDNLDMKILDKIKNNCRLSSLEISDGLNVSYKTVINRIKNLEKKNIILGYRLFMMSEELQPYIVLISYNNYSKKEESKLIEYTINHKNVTQTIRLFGIWNVFLHIRAKDVEHLQEILIDLRNSFDLIDDIETIPLFEDITINLMPT